MLQIEEERGGGKNERKSRKEQMGETSKEEAEHQHGDGGPLVLGFRLPASAPSGENYTCAQFNEQGLSNDLIRSFIFCLILN
jgi:hypothetical protein